MVISDREACLGCGSLFMEQCGKTYGCTSAGRVYMVYDWKAAKYAVLKLHIYARAIYACYG